MMIRKPISNTQRIALGIISVLMIVTIYSYLSHRVHVVNPKNTTMPNLLQFVEGFKRITGARQPVASWSDWFANFRDSWICSDIAATYGRLAAGLFFGVLLSLIVGVAMGCFSRAEAFFGPPLSFFARSRPPPCWRSTSSFSARNSACSWR